MESRPLFQILNWDSIFFGYKIAKIVASNLNQDELKNLLTKFNNLNIKLVYWFIDPADERSNEAAKNNKGFLADAKITYKISLSNYNFQKLDNQHLQSYLDKPINENILSLALQSGFYSRYKQDKKFIHNEFIRLYTTWIERSLNGEIAKDVIVYLDNESEKGLVTLEVKDNYGNIGLLAVDKKYRGKSIGKQLISAALIKFRAYGINKVKVTTQKKNIAACKFYEKIGFVKESVQNIYHFWLNE